MNDCIYYTTDAKMCTFTASLMECTGFIATLHVGNSLRKQRSERTYMVHNGDFGTKRTIGYSRDQIGKFRTHVHLACFSG